MRRAASAISAILLLLVLVGPASAGQGSEPEIAADLEGTPIEIAEISMYFCHDRSFPKIHCFATARALEQELASLDSSHGSFAAVAASDYVQVYAGVDRLGASMTLSQDYDTLVAVGWNDRIRSYRGLNGFSGIFYVDWFASGSHLAFCCNVVDPSLPATFDRAITSAYRT